MPLCKQWVDANTKPTPIADVVLAIMRTHRVNTMQELMNAEPEAMRTFLQTPNLQLINRLIDFSFKVQSNISENLKADVLPDCTVIHRVLAY